MKDDAVFMRKAISLSKKGLGWVNPNPLVGAVLVKDNRIIGTGYHSRFGEAHAELVAIRNASEDVKGSTLYVTLEPCNHQGKTPPCAPVIVDSGIREVVIGMADPNPTVNGDGIRYLRLKGVKIRSGILEKEIHFLNESFIKHITTDLPFCILKTAMTLDGKIATVTNASKWISCERSRRYVHELRQMVSGVLVGVNTVIYDDPFLNTRRPGKKSKDPLKIITDTRCRIPLEARVIRNNPQLAIIATTKRSDKNKLREIERQGVQVIICPEKSGMVDLGYLMKALGTMGLNSILIEGGSKLAFSAIREGVIDKVISFISPKILGGKEAPSPVGGEGIENMDDAIKIREWKMKRLGEDILIEGYIRNE